MKGIKGKFLKKLKTVKQIEYLKPDRILQVSNAFDGFINHFPVSKSNLVHKFPFKSTHSTPNPNPRSEECDNIDFTEHMRDIEDDGNAENCQPEKHVDGKENINPKSPENASLKLKDEGFDLKQLPLLELDILSFRRPDMDSGTLFDPNLLVAFNQAVTEHLKTWEESVVAKKKAKTLNPQYPFEIPEFEPDPLSEFEDQPDPLLEFDEKCPPGGSESVIFYTTSLRGIRKTFEDCQSIRFLLESLRVIYYERDVSTHLEFREELWEVMGEKMLPPRLFIRGRYIGGAEQVLGLHEKGKLKNLFRQIPIDYSEGPCNGCSGLRFGLCFNCNGSRKVFDQQGQSGDDDHHDDHDDHGQKGGGCWRNCTQCNENGLIVCPFCS